jgi:hypothetical protein
MPISITMSSFVGFPHVVTPMPVKQFSTLIMEPLEGALAMAGSPILIVVDALDECEHDGDVLLKIFRRFHHEAASTQDIHHDTSRVPHPNDTGPLSRS